MSELAILKRLCDAGPTLDFAKLGACRGMDSRIFYPERGTDQGSVAALCENCPVRLDCLAWAVCHEKCGTWGGASERTRRDLRKKLRITLDTPGHEWTQLGSEGGCGTVTGRRRHLTLGEPPCDKCREAYARYRNPQNKPIGNQASRWAEPIAARRRRLEVLEALG